MVAMQMGDKDMAHAGESHPGAAQLYLRALPTVYHKHLFANLYYLRRSVMPHGRQRTAAPEDVNLEWFHVLQWLSMGYLTQATAGAGA